MSEQNIQAMKEAIKKIQCRTCIKKIIKIGQAVRKGDE
jgi:hypothetical protein